MENEQPGRMAWGADGMAAPLISCVAEVRSWVKPFTHVSVFVQMLPLLVAVIV